MNQYFIISKSTELLADLDTPVSAFYKICDKKPYSFLLESVENNEKLGRYSLIGTEPILLFTNKNNKTYLETLFDKSTIELNSNPFLALKSLLSNITVADKNLNNYLGFVGYFGYENIRWIEPKVNLAPNKKTPDVCLIFPGKLIIFDHILHKVCLISNVLAQDKNQIESKKIEADKKLVSLLNEYKQLKPQEILSINFNAGTNVSYKSNFTKEEFISKVNYAKDHITKGDIFQVVPSQKIILDNTYNTFKLYRALRSINPSPYLFYINFKDFEIAGSSPEVMIKSEIQGNDKIAYLRPIAGTYPRGKDENEDLENISKLSSDPKERAEHLMLVDLARNDLGRVCKTGSIQIPEFMVIEKYSHVLHLVSLVKGILEKDKTLVDLLCATFPAGTLSGAPKVRAIEIINELEKEQRGPYGGCTGLFRLDDTINTCMTIRTFVAFKDHIEIQVGAGIVSDSNPESEYEETLRKGAALLKAVESYHGTTL